MATKKKPVKKAVARLKAIGPKVVRMPFGKIELKPGLEFAESLLLPKWLPRIVLIKGGVPVPLVVTGLKAGQRICWYNIDRAVYTIHFAQSDYPFSDYLGDFQVRSGQFSHVFTVKATGKSTPKAFSYAVWNGGLPPGPPQIVVDP